MRTRLTPAMFSALIFLFLFCSSSHTFAACEQHDFGDDNPQVTTQYYIYSDGRTWDFTAENTSTITSIEVKSILASYGGTFFLELKLNGTVIDSWSHYVNSTTYKPYIHQKNLSFDLRAGDIITYFIYGGSFYDPVGGLLDENYVKLCYTDEDDDGMPDDWESQYGLNPLVNDASKDPDQDGLTNLQEYRNNTNPKSKDTDSDGMPDGWEIQYGLDPRLNSASGDLDGDELNNLQEYQNNTDPQKKDTDGDGMPDGWEVQYSLDPLANDSSLDKDNDGYNNLAEYEKGTDPDDPKSYPSKAMPWIPLLLLE